MIHIEIEKIKHFKWSEVHKKFGKIIFHEPCDSDIHEGNFMAQVWFSTGGVWYLIEEWDTRVSGEQL